MISGTVASAVFADIATELSQGLASWKLLKNSYLNRPEGELDDPPSSSEKTSGDSEREKLSPTGPPAIRFDNVTMAYPKQPERLSLRGLTMTLEAGKVTASAGKSGSGKSTVLAVLQRFYEVQLGSIQLDGVDVSNMSAQSLRKRIALVSQAAVLFEGSIRLNLSLGSPEPESVTQADLDHACQQACILDFVRGLPDGFETDIGLKGLRLSGGQRHRLCIARALLAKADISLLDEATSVLNAKSEALVEKALRNASVSRTTIVIAHKLQSLLSADKIVVLHEGAAVEEGTHAELMAKDEHYRRLVENQLQ